MDFITKFQGSSLLLVALFIFIILFALFLNFINKRKEQRIDGFFIVIEPYNKKRKTVRLVELTAKQVDNLKKIEKETEKDTTNNPQPWVEAFEKLRLSSDDIFDWKPLNGANDQTYVKNDILSIQPVGKALIIGITLRLPISPKL